MLKSWWQSSANCAETYSGWDWDAFPRKMRRAEDFYAKSKAKGGTPDACTSEPLLAALKRRGILRPKPASSTRSRGAYVHNASARKQESKLLSKPKTLNVRPTTCVLVTCYLQGEEARVRSTSATGTSIMPEGCEGTASTSAESTGKVTAPSWVKTPICSKAGRQPEAPAKEVARPDAAG